MPKTTVYTIHAKMILTGDTRNVTQEWMVGEGHKEMMTKILLTQP